VNAASHFDGMGPLSPELGHRYQERNALHSRADIVRYALGRGWLKDA
jgi:hypothetical protein